MGAGKGASDSKRRPLSRSGAAGEGDGAWGGRARRAARRGGALRTPRHGRDPSTGWPRPPRWAWRGRRALWRALGAVAPRTARWARAARRRAHAARRHRAAPLLPPRARLLCRARRGRVALARHARCARRAPPEAREKKRAPTAPPPPSPARAGLQFPVGRCHRLLKVGGARGAPGRARARRARGPTRPIPPVARHGQRPRRRHRRRLHRRHPRYESGGLEEEEAPRASKEGPRAMGRASARPQKGRPPRPRPPRAPSAALDARVAIKRRPWDGVRGVDEGVGVVTGAHFFERGAPWSGAPRRPPVLSPFHQSTSPPRCWSWPATRPRT